MEEGGGYSDLFQKLFPTWKIVIKILFRVAKM